MAIYCNTLRGRYKELIIYITAYFFVHCPLYSVLHIIFLEAAFDSYLLE